MLTATVFFRSTSIRASLTVFAFGIFNLLGQGYAQTLKDGVEKGLCHSPSVKKAIAEASRSFHEITRVRAGTLPQASLDTSGGAAFRNRSIEGLQVANGDALLSREARFTIDQILFDFGTNRLLTESAVLRNEFQRLLIEDVREQQAGLIAETYLEVFKNRLELKVIEAHLSTLLKILEDARNLEVEEGKDDSLVLEGRVLMARSKMTEVMAKMKGLETRFKLLTCMDGTAGMGLVKMPTSICDHIDIMESPQVRAAELAIKVSEANIQASRQDKLPKFYFEGESAIGENVAGISGSDKEWGALITMKWNVFDGYRKKAIVCQNMAELDKDLAAREDVILAIKDTVGSNQEELNGAIKRRTQLLEARGKISESLKLYKAKLEAGEKKATLLGLANNNREYLAIELDSIGALISGYQAAVRGMVAAGGFLEYLGIESAECCMEKAASD